MAARRLLIVMVILLVISSLAAALVPPPPDSTSSSTTESTPKEPVENPEPVRGKQVALRVDAASEAPRRLGVAVGDQLSITVTSPRFVEVAIPEYGLLESATEGSPARFDLLVDEPGKFEVRAVKPSRELARIVAKEPARPDGDSAGGQGAGSKPSQSTRSGER